MKNYLSDGDQITVTAPSGGTTSGTPIVLGSLFGVPAATVDEGDLVALSLEGTFRLPKKGTTVFAAGAKVSWDSANGYCDEPGTGLYPVGAAIEAAGAGATEITVRLTGAPTAAA